MTTTLITGASSGIGAALADLAAEHGHNVVLVARRAERLASIADRLTSDHGVRCLVVVADLSLPDAAARVHDEVVVHGWTVEVLVNNAGFSCDGRFLEVAWADHRRLLRVLVETPAELIHRFLPAMVERRYGRIVNVASVAGLVPGSPYETLYGPAKHALVALTRNLAEEYRGRGVRFVALCPGVTPTGMTEVGFGRELMARTPKVLISSPRSVAEAAWKSIDSRSTVVVPGLANRVAVRALRLLPAGLATRLAGATVT